MSDQLNAYSDWLAIAPHEQPPNYYRLLELPLYERDPERIQAGARRQLQRVSPHIGGPHRDTAHGIANEITAAGQCLLDPKAKQEYDAHLLAVGITQPAETRTSPVEVSPRALNTRSSKSNKRQGRGKQRRYQLAGHLLVPLISLAIAWGILRTLRPGFDPLKFLASSQVQPPEEASEPRPPATAPRHRRDARSPEKQPELSTAELAPVQPLPDLSTLLEPMPEPAKVSFLALLPDAVDLPSHDDPGWLAVAEPVPSQTTPCGLVLISNRLTGEHDRRLELRESTPSPGVTSWKVQVPPLSALDADAAEQPDLPLAEFLWQEGQLKFQWKFAGDETLRSALRNALLNVSVDGEEKLMQLRRPVKVPSLTLDLSKDSLQMPLEIPHLPPLDQLRLGLTQIDFSALDHQLDEGQADAHVGQKLPILVTTPPGVRFHIWLQSTGNQLTFRAEGHYWLGGATPIEFSQSRVEKQMSTFLANRRKAEVAIPRLQNSVRALEANLIASNRRLGQLPRTLPYAQARASLALQIRGMQASIAAGKTQQVQARQTLEVTSKAVPALQEVAKLGGAIHNQTPFQYRVYLPFEFEGVALEVVLLEAAGDEVTAPADVRRTLATEPLTKTALREPVPSEADLQAARASLAAEYKKTYQEADDAAARHRLAVTLLEQAEITVDDLPRQYEMFRLAWVILVQAGDLAAALETAGQIEQQFKVNGVQLRADILRTASGSPSFSARFSLIVAEILSMTSKAVLTEDPELGGELLELAQVLQAKAPNAQHARQIEQRLAFLDAEQQLEAEKSRLQFHPDDAEGHLRFGRLALGQGRPWEDCLTALSNGGDDPLAEAARADLLTPEAAADQVEVGDRWFELASSEGPLQLRLEQRAAKWYSEALPQLQGFSKTKVETRLNSLDALEPSRREEPNAAKPPRQQQ